MAKMWGIFREYGPPGEIPENLYTMEIFHGGYFDKKLDGTWKYKVPKFNKLGGKIYLDGLDPDLISWVEMNNIAHALGYREKPISYHFKIPRTPPNEGFIQIKSDGDAIEMVKMIPLKKRQITVYITGGGPRKKEEAYAEFALPPDEDFANPLNNQTLREKERAFFEANLMASRLYSERYGVNAVGGSARVNAEVEAEIIDLANDSGSAGNIVGEDRSGVNVEGGPSQSTFAGLSDIVPDIMGSQACVGQGEVGQGGNTAIRHGHMGNLQPPKAKPRRVKHTAKRLWPTSARNALNKKLEDIEKRAREDGEKREREEFERAEREAVEFRESQASAAVSVEEVEQREREKAEKKEREAAEQKAREEAKLREREASEKRARDALAVRQQLVAELEKRQAEKQKSKAVGKQTSKAAQNKGKEPIHHKAKSNRKGKKPREPRYNTRHKGQKKFEAQVEEDDDSSDGSDFYVDSDYDIENDECDDVQFEENVTEPRVVPEYEEMGFTGYCSEEAVDSDDLQSLSGSESEEDGDGNPIPKRRKKGLRVRPWIRLVDLKNPKFRLGLAFPNSAQLKEAVRECAIRNQLGLWFEKNSKKKIEVNCQSDCPFRLYASPSKGEGDTLIIKTLNNKHTCSPVETSHFLTYRRIAQEVAEDLMVDENWSRKGIHNHIEKKYKLDVGVQTITRAKRAAKRMNEGHYIDQYNMLAAYRKELLRSNPGSTIDIKTQMDGPVRRFHRMYICFAACKEGWMRGCRPIVCLDGCHVKGQHPGQLLTAVGIDANNGMFPVAYALCEVENQETWTWFLDYLKCDLRMERDSSYVFMTDKQKGLGNAIANLFPNAEHRHCVRHLYNNFKSKHPGEGLKQLVWNAARSSTQVWYNKHMDALRELDEDAWLWFQDKSPAQWLRAFFRDESKCDILLNNMCESFNSAILPARDKPILTMLEKIRMDVMVRNANRRVACEKWKDLVGPRIKKIIDKIGQRATQYRAHRSGEFIFQIIGTGEGGSKHAVDLGLHTCTCKRWQLSGIPCVHAICAIRFKKQEAALYCDDYLMPSSYMEAYNPIIYPIAGEDDWELVDYPIAPPPYKQQAGRPKMKRHKEPGEKENIHHHLLLKKGNSLKLGLRCPAK
ncbi:uncharacterized protein LOC133727313 [Rosa rugosa]|uniref:uncharacterized protein LOC133727313 n=1 Tax=Rosa rugosa TaxID=74645 RepID=UPI002B412218|nr:uncharacterized protein LOC133727313 [Rosa rugosa]